MIDAALRALVLVSLDDRIADVEDAEQAERLRVERLIETRQIADGDHHWQAGLRLRDTLIGLRAARAVAGDELNSQNQEGRP